MLGFAAEEETTKPAVEKKRRLRGTERPAERAREEEEVKTLWFEFCITSDGERAYNTSN
ncbi:hypothetical protein QJS04_geneDACA024135 [Acorus gramineus]|uniref:Uncharacterized protein n=1 Tax=Acorus gramineus TaxID=55184 RepID=A0AAV8ZYP6_ACOGR|nr:hypothetical protein QJS04_geneDACA024135 [Acorus gramineus]